LPIISNAGSRDIERLATVCKVIQDIKSDDLLKVQSEMHAWKGDKFSDTEVEKSLKFIKLKQWNKMLLV